VEHIGKLLQEIGLEGRRIRMVNTSSAMGAQFAQFATDMTMEIAEIGPNPLRLN
jgi:coenzyme F420-reducing hydrogenase delta subunit